MKSDRQKLIVWASGLIEFIGDKPVPDGAIHVCTALGQDAIEFLFDQVREQSVLHDFGDIVGLRVPEIDADRSHVEVGVDLAVEQLIIWEDYLRDLVGNDDEIEWTRA